MEIVKMSNGSCQLIDSATDAVVCQGTYDECWDRLVAYDIEHEDEHYARHLTLTGF